MKNYLKIHRYAVSIAVIAGILSVLPYVCAPLSIEYKGIPFLYQDNEDVYLSRIREVTEGNINISSPVFCEYKSLQTAQQPMGEWLYALLSLVIPLTILVIFLKFLFPCILFLLIYHFVLRIDDKKVPALFAATVCVLGFDMLRVSFLKEIILGNEGLYLSVWTRLVNPITGAIFLFSFLHLLISLFEKRNWKYTLAAGIVLGCMTGYYFSFVLVCTILGLFCVYLLYKKDFTLLKFFAPIFLIGFIINIHYAWSIVHTIGSDALKSGMILTHHPLINKMQIFVLLLLGATYYKFKNTKIWLVSALFAVSSCIAINIHVITGGAIWPQHFVQYTNLLAIISVTVLLSHWLKKFYVAGIITILLLVITTIPSYTLKLSEFQDKQRLASAFTWLNNQSGDCVVLAYERSAKIAWVIPAYTKCDTYISPYVFSNVPKERIMHNFLTMLSIRGGDFTTDDMREYFFRDWRDLFAHQPDAWLSSISDTKEMETYYQGLEKEIKENYKTFHFEKKYRMDYIIWDSKNASSTDPRKNKGIQQVFEDSGIFIFKI